MWERFRTEPLVHTLAMHAAIVNAPRPSFPFALQRTSSLHMHVGRSPRGVPGPGRLHH